MSHDALPRQALGKSWLIGAGVLLVVASAGLAYCVHLLQSDYKKKDDSSIVQVPDSDEDETSKAGSGNGPRKSSPIVSNPKKVDSTLDDPQDKPKPKKSVSSKPLKPSQPKTTDQPKPSQPTKPKPGKPKKPKPSKPTKPKTTQPVTWKEGEVFYQEVLVSRQSSYRFLGGDITQNVQYGFLSRFKIEKKNADGSMVVTQKVEKATFGKGDPVMQKLLNDALQKTKGATFAMTLSPQRQVIKFQGAGNGIQILGGNNILSGQAFMLWSFMDRDGWKELAEVSLFHPAKLPGTSARWSRKMTHGWGPLGSWSGNVWYAYAGQKKGLEQIAYQLDMAYQPPRRGGGLPFTIVRAAFKPQTAAGLILYDAKLGKVSAAEERFHVKGVLLISVLGLSVAIEMDEAQVFQVRNLQNSP